MLRRMMKGLKKQEGFTLLEVLVVIAILGIIAAMITPKFLEVMKEARRDTAVAGAKQIQTGLERINFRNNAYPATTAITNYAQLVSVLGSAANLPAAVGNDAPANGTIGFNYYSNTSNVYRLELTVTNGTSDCVIVTPTSISTGTCTTP